jgi:hypothetical protein
VDETERALRAAVQENPGLAELAGDPDPAVHNALRAFFETPQAP